MSLSEKKLKELKKNKISIEELNEKYFYTKKDGFNVETVLKLLNENVCSFQQIVDKFKMIKAEHDAPCLNSLLNNKEFFKELIKNNKLTKDDLKHVLNVIDNYYELYALRENTTLLRYIVDTELFRELVNTFKRIENDRNKPCLYVLLENKKFFGELIKNEKLTQKDLRYLLKRVDNTAETLILSRNTSLLKHIVDNSVSFKELVDKFENTKDLNNNPCLHLLLGNKDFFEELIQNNRLNEEDLNYLLNRIDDNNDLRELCRNTPLIKYVLNEFVLNTKDVDKFNTLIANNDWCKDRNIHTIFDRIEYETKNNEEILRLNELNKYVCSFDLNENQRVELVEIMKDSEIAQNTLIQIVENHLEDTYDFESLKNLLTKDEEKKKIKMNF